MPRKGATRVETTYYNNKVVKVMVWEWESDTSASGKIVYEKAGWKQQIILTEGKSNGT